MRSFQRLHPDAHLYVFIVDLDRRAMPGAEPFTVLGRADVGLASAELEQRAAIYDPWELCCSLKPWVVRHLLDTHEVVVYLDSDIKVYDAFDEGFFEAARESGIVLTPHYSADSSEVDFGREKDLLLTGRFNLGSFAVSDRGREFLTWLDQRLSRHCIYALESGLFVDQKWLDLGVSYFPHAVWADPAYNVACWNLHERQVAHEHGTFAVNGRPLRFFHFSGFDPARPTLISRHPWVLEPEVDPESALGLICADYAADLLADGFAEFRRRPYLYAESRGGLPIDQFMRRLVRESLIDDPRNPPPNPFTSVESAAAFESWLGAPASAAGRLGRYLAFVYRQRADLHGAFADVEGRDYDDFLRWARTSGPNEGVNARFAGVSTEPDAAEEGAAVASEIGPDAGSLFVIDELTRLSTGEVLHGFDLDSPRQGSTAEGGIQLQGWAVARTDQAVAVEVVSEGRVLSRSPVELARPDVAEALRGIDANTRNSGFRTNVSIGPITELDLLVQVVLADQRRIPCWRIRGRRTWRADEEGGSPLVSVILPCYNQAHFLPEALESVLSQTYGNFEVCVVDDGSTDNTLAIARSYIGVHCVAQRHQGASAARNQGIRETLGRLLVFLDADDRLLPGALEAGVRTMQASPECGFVYGLWRLIDAAGEPLGPVDQPCQDDITVELFKTCFLGLGAVMFRREVLERRHPFDPSLEAGEDWDLYLSILRRFPVSCHGRLVLEYRRHGTNVSSDPAKVLSGELRVLRRHRRWARSFPGGAEAIRLGIERTRDRHSSAAARRMGGKLRRGQLGGALKDAARLVRNRLPTAP